MKRILKGSGGNKINLKVRKLLQFKIFLKAINTHGGACRIKEARGVLYALSSVAGVDATEF